MTAPTLRDERDAALALVDALKLDVARVEADAREFLARAKAAEKDAGRLRALACELLKGTGRGEMSVEYMRVEYVTLATIRDMIANSPRAPERVQTPASRIPPDALGRFGVVHNGVYYVSKDEWREGE